MIRAMLVAICVSLPGLGLAQDVTAVLEPLRSVELRSTVNGRVTQIIELEGARIEEGDVIAEIDATVQRARVELAKM